MTESAFLLKDHINPHSIRFLSERISECHPDFPAETFIARANSKLDAMALKARISHLSESLAIVLPDDYSHNAKWLKQLACNWPELDAAKGWHSFIAWPLIDYAGKQGMKQPEIALDLLKTLTPLFTAEFAIRPYIEHHFDMTYHQLLQWCTDDNAHVRRLASEGLRPRLPWGGHLKQLQQDPQPVLQLLERLKDDPSRYVQKSVANNLNDISKDHPEQVLRTCRQWLKEATPQRRWIIRHGLRSLIKAGEPAVFPLLGFSENLDVEVEFALDRRQVNIGERVALQAVLCSSSTQKQSLVVDYRIWHVKANGSRTAKVYKWKNLLLMPGKSIQLDKSHGFFELTTRRYYAGTHVIELLLNGNVKASAEFSLIV